MKKIGFPFVLMFFCMGMMFSPQPVSAKLRAMNENQMKDAVGQYGINIATSDKMELDVEFEHVAFGDNDGTGDGKGAFLSFNNTSLKVVITMSNPISLKLSNRPNPFTDAINTGLDIRVDGVTIDIPYYSIESITVGSEVGEGASFGSIVIKDYHAVISGNLRIWAD